ncbi:MAG: type II toxin-antitoxin system RelB/DinJ family antitoxin [Chrysiogenales bacterium]
MNKESSTLTVRTNKKLKNEVGDIFKNLGLTHSTAINIFYHQVLSQNGIPFAVKIPNKETIAALKNSRKGKNLTAYKNSSHLFKELDI